MVSSPVDTVCDIHNYVHVYTLHYVYNDTILRDTSLGPVSLTLVQSILLPSAASLGLVVWGRGGGEGETGRREKVQPHTNGK